MAKPISNPPDWKNELSSELFTRALESKSLQEIIEKSQKDYVHWDKFKHFTFPQEFTPQESWAYLKFIRLSNRSYLPLQSFEDKAFSYVLTKSMYQKLSYIDSNTSGFLISNIGAPTQKQKKLLVLSGISEEAIASSQIEGANTSRKKAKQMLLQNQKPRNKDEQMIINNYQVMQRLAEWKDVSLSRKMLLDIQLNITKHTLDEPEDSGRFRNDEDEIQIVDRITGLVAHIPPPESFYQKELDKLIEFANKDGGEEEFLHPVVKAIVIHFWLAYLHPFPDGNGRTARALFYWYLLRKGYWLFNYLSVSRSIKFSRTQYDKAFLFSEKDDADMSYFLQYHLSVVVKAIKSFVDHLESKLLEEKKLQRLEKKEETEGLNERQLALLFFLFTHSDEQTDIYTHQKKNGVVYQTARTDILELEAKNYLVRMKRGRRYIFIANVEMITNLFKE
jgi:Fic family protein